jgi:hypothetical protein
VDSDISSLKLKLRGCHGHDHIVVGLLPMQSVPITTNVVSSNPTQVDYVIKFVSDLRQVSGFLKVLRFPP